MIGKIAGAGKTLSLKGNTEVSKDQALEIIGRVKSGLSRSAQRSGILVLMNCGGGDGRIELVQKNRHQLFFSGLVNKKRQGFELSCTRDYLAGVLTAAGLNDAVGELANHLANKPPGYQNIIEASYVRELLERHSPAGAMISSAPTRSRLTSSNRTSPELVTANSLSELLREIRISRVGRTLGEGAYGVVREVQFAGDEQTPRVFKTYIKKQMPIHLRRDGTLNDGLAAYLTSKKDQSYAAEVGVIQPEHYIVSADGFYSMVGPLGLRQLIKANPAEKWHCHGLLMPKAAGVEVLQLIRRGKLEAEDRRNVALGVLKSLKKLKQRGFVHRDIKPANLFYDKSSGKVTLIDTGLLHKSSKSDPKTNFIEGGDIGTAVYMHPRALVRRAHGAETDLYALAIMAIEMEHPKACWSTFGNRQGKFFISIRDLVNDESGRANDVFDARFYKDSLDDFISINSPNPEAVAELKALRAALDDPASMAGFAMECLDFASRPAEDWADQATAQAMYEQLMAHPALADSSGNPVH